MSDKLSFVDTENAHNRGLWWEQELEEVTQCYAIPMYNIPPGYPHIKFKRKHFLWWEYHQLFLRLKNETNSELRKTLRRNLENKRKQITLADNCYVENFLNSFMKLAEV